MLARPPEVSLNWPQVNSRLCAGVSRRADILAGEGDAMGGMLMLYGVNARHLEAPHTSCVSCNLAILKMALPYYSPTAPTQNIPTPCPTTKPSAAAGLLGQRA